ncbi:putative argininosuccinate lyase [Fusarium oxysporum f. sp. albedinis]|nr:putative argininosuccinate lyase [Fusarium oxysporum f. sp. albedinis]
MELSVCIFFTHAPSYWIFRSSLNSMLVQHRVDPIQRDIEGRNLVHWAATFDYVDAMELISEMPGVKVGQRDRYGKTAIDMALI